jgi:meiotic recombination protein REC8
MDLDLPVFDDEFALPQLSPGGPVQHVSSQHFDSSFVIDSNEEEQVGAPLARSKPAKVVPTDRRTELLRRELSSNQQNYLENMLAAHKAHLLRKIPFQAKRNAEHWIWGTGINDIGVGIPGLNHSPLAAIFSGLNLCGMITGMTKQVTSRKRRSDGAAEENEARRTRARLGDELELPRAQDDDFYLPPQDDIELPREGTRELADPSSAMP